MNSTTSPRLFLTSEHYAGLKDIPDTPLMQQASCLLTEMAEQFLCDSQIKLDETSHNWHLIRARRMQIRLMTLLVQWKRTGQARYFEGILADLKRMIEWEYWSWIMWRASNPDPGAIFDLSYGENSTTLALVFDALRGEFDEGTTAWLVEAARMRSLQPYLQRTQDEPPGWYRAVHSNWNAVCNGGAGMLALAMADLCPEAPEVLQRVEHGIERFFTGMDEEGTWPEGVGYWNYGMRYGFMYLLSHETATRQAHPLLALPGTIATLRFPLDLSPHNVSCGFGDANAFSPEPFHLAAARRLGMEDVVGEVMHRFELKLPLRQSTNWPQEAELLLLAPRRMATSGVESWDDARLYKDLQWGFVADRMPDSQLYVSARGGSIDAPHTHRDLLSFNCLVGDEKLIENVPVDDYIDTTFSARREELYEVSPLSKNSIFVNGVGIAAKGVAPASWLEGEGFAGFRFDATKAMGTMRDGDNACFCGRAILLLDKRAVLIVDQVELAYAGLAESRLHTFYDVEWGEDSVSVLGRKNRLHISFASTQPALIKRGLGLPTNSRRDPDNIIRHMNAGKIFQITFCQLLVPNGTGRVALSETATGLQIETDGDVPFKLTCGPRLQFPAS